MTVLGRQSQPAHFSTGRNRLVAHRDSNTAPPSSSYRTSWACGTDIMKHSTEVYHMVVTPSRTATAGSARVAALRNFDRFPG